MTSVNQGIGISVPEKVENGGGEICKGKNDTMEEIMLRHLTLS